MAKQTLKQLLGTSDERVQVELNLATPRLRNVIERGGSYSTAFVNAPKTNNFARIADALGKINPIIEQYQKSKQIGQQAELAKAKGALLSERIGLTEKKTELIQTEIDQIQAEAGIEGFKNFLSGATPEAKNEIITTLAKRQEQTKEAIDAEFRQEYGLNPLASIRAERLLGATKEAEYLAFRNEAVEQYKQNMGGKVPSQEDIEEFVYGLADGFLDENDIQMEKGSLMHQGFMSSIMEQTGKDVSTLQTAFSEYHRDNIAVPAIANNFYSAYKHSFIDKGYDDSVIQLETAWKDTGMLEPAQQENVIKQTFNLIRPENSDEAEDFLELLASSNIKIGTQKFEDTTLYEEIAQNIEDKAEVYEAEQDKELAEAHKSTILEYTKTLNNYYDEGRVGEALDWITQTEQDLMDTIEANGGEATDYENETLIWLSKERYGQDSAIQQRYENIQARSGLTDSRLNNLFERAVGEGSALFNSQSPKKVVEAFESFDGEEKPPFEYDLITDEFTVNLEGYHDFSGASRRWQEGTREALDYVLGLGLDPAEQGKQYAILQETVDDNFVRELTTLVANSNRVRAQKQLDKEAVAGVEKVEDVMSKASSEFYKRGGRQEVDRLTQATRSRRTRGGGKFTNDNVILNAYGGSILEIEDETEKQEERNNFYNLVNSVRKINEATREDLISQADQFNKTPEGNIRERQNHESRRKYFISKNSEKFEEALLLETFNPSEVVSLLETGAARGNTTRELRHSSGFRLQPDFFSPANLVYIEGLDKDSDETKRISELLNIPVDTLIEFHEGLRKIREQ